MFIVISYDIANDRRRTKVAHALEGNGTRVQYSVFEFNLTPHQLKQVQARLRKLIDPRVDRVRIYVVPADAVPAIVVLGHGEVTRDVPFYVV